MTKPQTWEERFTKECCIGEDVTVSRDTVIDFFRSQIEKARKEAAQEAVAPIIQSGTIDKELYDSIKYNFGFKAGKISGLERAIQIAEKELMFMSCTCLKRIHENIEKEIKK